MLDHLHGPHTLHVAITYLDGGQPLRCGPTTLGRPCPAGRRAPLRHPTADLHDDRPTAPAALHHEPRLAGGLVRSRSRWLAARVTSHTTYYITTKSADATNARGVWHMHRAPSVLLETALSVITGAREFA